MERTIRVLLVDDEADFIEPVAFWLKSKGYAITAASNGAEAIALIKRDAPDIVFLDLHMPIMDGLQTLRRIRGFNKDLPVIIITAVYQDRESFTQANALGISGFFPKQSSLSSLARIIETSLKAHAKLKSPPA